jgi:hypothetical protein
MWCDGGVGCGVGLLWLRPSCSLRSSHELIKRIAVPHHRVWRSLQDLTATAHARGSTHTRSIGPQKGAHCVCGSAEGLAHACTPKAPARTVTRTARFFLPDVDPIRAHFTSSHFHLHNRTMMSPWMVVVVAVLMAVTPSDAQFTKRNRTMATRACRPEFASMPWCDTTKTVSD